MNYLEVYFNGVLKQSLSIEKNVISIGRTSSNDLIIDNMGVSSHHAIISIEDDLYYIEDLNSTNGTFVNSQKLSSKHKINTKDSINIGKHTLKLSEWSQSTQLSSTEVAHESDDATIIINKRQTDKSNKSDPIDLQQKQYYLLIKGERTGKNKLLLTANNYGIGKAKDNIIRMGGWLTPAHFAEIEKIGHSFYISPLKKRKVKLNGQHINSSVLLSPLDEVRIKNLRIKFLSD